jgi:hypothetical protein
VNLLITKNQSVNHVQQPTYEQAVLVPIQKANEAYRAEQARLEAVRVAQVAEAERVAQEQARAAQIASVQVSAPSVSAPVAQVPVSGSCAQWMANAGIDDVANAMYILNRESGCNPYAWNASSGAGGLPQALPFSKMGCALGDGQCQMNWFKGYVMGRYGSFANAAAHSRATGWY